MPRKIFALLFVVVFLVSCDITKILDPANTTYMLIKFNLDGKNWLPTFPDGYEPNMSLVEGQVDSKMVAIYAHRGETKFLRPADFIEHEFTLFFKAFPEPGKYNLSENAENVSAMLRIGDGEEWTEHYKLNPKLGGYIKIDKFQPQNEFCQGDFEFVFEEVQTGETKKVKNGRFAISTTSFFK